MAIGNCASRECFVSAVSQKGTFFWLASREAAVAMVAIGSRGGYSDCGGRRDFGWASFSLKKDVVADFCRDPSLMSQLANNFILVLQPRTKMLK